MELKEIIKGKKGCKVIFSLALVALLSFFFGINHVSATTSLTLTVSSSTVGLNIAPTRATGTFAKSDDVNISASTDNSTGYTLAISAANSADYNKLKNGNDYLISVSEPTTEEAFKALNGTAYNGMWGYLPSKYHSEANVDFLPAPPASGDILDVTETANATPNEYSLAIGARVDSTTKIGSYTNVYNVILVANAIPYTITYKDSVISNMPTDVDSTSESETVYISGETPVRSGYTFIGWCTVAPTQSTLTSTCSGTTYSPSQAHQIDGSSLANDLTLYAMWRRNTMQNVSDWQSSVGIGEETTAVDTRDGNIYTVARLCMSAATHTLPALNTCDRTMLWMTQNLDLKLGPAGSQTLTNADTDLNTVTSWTPGNTAKVPAVITNHAPNHPTNSVTGWTNDNSQPYWAEGGDYYVYTSGNNNTDVIYNSMTACISGGHTEEQCRHYHAGNYYNWSAAVASNNTSSTTTDLTVMPNSICPKGWRLPNALTGSIGSEIITEYNQLGLANGITSQITVEHNSGSVKVVNTGWATNNTSFNNFRAISTNAAGYEAPMYFSRSGNINATTIRDYGQWGIFWTSTSQSTPFAYYLAFYSDEFYPAAQLNRFYGFSIRCVAR